MLIRDVLIVDDEHKSRETLRLALEDQNETGLQNKNAKASQVPAVTSV